ncbi:MAG TPA: hypothetical protein P5050_10880 [Bacteroidia bacterium]|nr:hypothetical protein [Bacteroidia bacterium]HRS59710.1 hypothetical protein [Bacteroidia bacterium]HRU68683.1 hypothetical protein [Bacteroidia bacterium]
MKNVRLIFVFVALIAIFNACQKDFDLQKTPKPAYDLVYASYDQTSVDSIICFMDPVFYDQVYKKKDSTEVHIAVIPGYYADKAPNGDGYWLGHCVPSLKYCFVVYDHRHMIPASQCPELQSTYGYNPENLEYKAFIVICRDGMPQLIQGKVESLVQDENEVVTSFSFKQINQKMITWNGEEIAGEL